MTRREATGKTIILAFLLSLLPLVGGLLFGDWHYKYLHGRGADWRELLVAVMLALPLLYVIVSRIREELQHR